MFRRVARALLRRARGMVRGSGSGRVAWSDPASAYLFDAEFYSETYPDVATAGADPAQHYAVFGKAELRQPSVLFDPRWYLEQYPFTPGAVADPLEHFLKHGGAEGRDPIKAGFSSAWYLSQHPDVAAAGVNPLVHFVKEGAALGYDPCPDFDVRWYLEQNPDVRASRLNPLAHYLRFGREEGRAPNPRGTSITGAPGEDPPRSVSVPGVLGNRSPDLRLVRSIPAPAEPRINLVTDSIGSDSLFGGVATAIVLASLWANRTGRRLRIVTRHRPPDGAGLENLYRATGVRPDRQPELEFAPCGPGDYLPVGDDDVFLTTSWWTTTAVLETFPPSKVVYILQEDERSFYPVGTDGLRAAAAMNHPDLKVVVNTSGLLAHLVSTGVPNLATTAVAFEPSFAAFLRPGRVLGSEGPHDLFFYARPNNPRNLFDLGLAALDGAVEAGHLPRSRWRINLVGRSVPRVAFGDGARPVVHDDLGWSEYREFLGGIDLGLSLMASPHPSYPPLDLAAGGSFVVTNRWPGKLDLTAVSDRVVTAEPQLDDLVEAIGAAAALVDERADEPFEPTASPLFAPWKDNLAPVVEQLAGWFGDA